MPTPVEVVSIRDSAYEVQPAKVQDGGSVYEGKVSMVTKDRGPRSIEGAIIYVLPEEAWLRMQSNLQPVLLPMHADLSAISGLNAIMRDAEYGRKFW